MNCFITGASGFLGKYIVQGLVDKYDKIYLLSRGDSLKRNIKLFKKFNNVEFLTGDITQVHIFDNIKDKYKVIEDVQDIIHLAAYYNLEGSFKDCNLYNVIGTQNIVHLVSQCEVLKSFHYASTIAVAGDYEGMFFEDKLEYDQEFTNEYARSKFQAELFVNSMKDTSIKTRVYRLGILVGDSQSGRIEKIDGPYYVFEFLKKLLDNFSVVKKMPLLMLPYNPRTLYPQIPVDKASEFMCQSITSPSEHKNRTYHVVSSPLVKMDTMIKDMLSFYGINAKVKPLPYISFYNDLFTKLGLPSEIIHYLFAGVNYDSSNLKEDFPNIQGHSYPEYKTNFFKYYLNKAD